MAITDLISAAVEIVKGNTQEFEVLSKGSDTANATLREHK